MSALEDYYRQQPSSNAAYHSELANMQQEAAERGVSMQQIERDRQETAADYRKAEAERVAALVSDPATLRALRAYWAPRPIAPDGSVAPRAPDPLAPPPAPPAPPAWKVASDKANAERDLHKRWRAYVREHPTYTSIRDGLLHDRDPNTPPSWFV